MKKSTKIFTVISRLLVGCVFVFSGFVKGIDPLGTAYRIEDYFIAFGTQWAIPSALYLSVFLCTIEFSVGILLLLNVRIKEVAWLLLLMMLFFTCTTFYDALYNPVPDCGCFGDAIKLTNWQTFLKNIILMIFVLTVFLNRKKIKPYFRINSEILIIFLTIITFDAFSMYNYRHLPVIDFMSWKVGNKMFNEHPLPVKCYLTYRNKETGETKEYLSPDFPYNDTAWVAKWEFVSQRIEDPNSLKGTDLQITDSSGNDVTSEFIRNPGYQFILVAYDLEKTHLKAFTRMNDFYGLAEKDGHSLIALYSIGNVKSFINKTKAAYAFYSADDVILKTMVRANPGLLLLKNGVVLAKWHYHDFPDYNQVKKKYLK